MSLSDLNTDFSSFYFFVHNGIVTNKMSECLDDLIGIQEKLFDFGLTMSGFQFVGLILENSRSILGGVKPSDLCDYGSHPCP